MVKQNDFELTSLEDLLLHQIGGLYDAECRWLDCLKSITPHANNDCLRAALAEQAAETSQQINRLENAFALAGLNPRRWTCQAMRGLVQECQQLVDAEGNSAVKEAAVLAAVQKVKHYEIAAYGASRNFALRCEQPGIADLLQQSLDEEGDADQHLTELAENIINAKAADSETR